MHVFFRNAQIPESLGASTVMNRTPARFKSNEIARNAVIYEHDPAVAVEPGDDLAKLYVLNRHNVLSWFSMNYEREGGLGASFQKYAPFSFAVTQNVEAENYMPRSNLKDDDTKWYPSAYSHYPSNYVPVFPMMLLLFLVLMAVAMLCVVRLTTILWSLGDKHRERQLQREQDEQQEDNQREEDVELPENSYLQDDDESIQ